MYRSLHGTAPQYMTESCTQTADVVSRQHLRSASQRKMMIVLRYRMDSYGRRCFAVVGPLTWNSSVCRCAGSVFVCRHRCQGLVALSLGTRRHLSLAEQLCQAFDRTTAWQFHTVAVLLRNIAELPCTMQATGYSLLRHYSKHTSSNLCFTFTQIGVVLLLVSDISRHIAIILVAMKR